jgi:hypothetical protein
MLDLAPIFRKSYPENSIGGECGTFAHHFVDFPVVGNSYGQKKAIVNAYGIPIGNVDGDFRPGDVIVCSDGTFMGMGAGHVAVVNLCSAGYLWLTESNFHNDGRVHHTRMIPKTYPKIYGMLRGQFKFDLPAPTFPVQLTTTILLNNQQWSKTLLAKMAQLQDWFYTASQNRIELIIDYKLVSLNGWNTLFYGTDPRVEAIAENWFDRNVPMGSDINLFVIASKDWHGQVFNVPGAYELGYCYARRPIKAMIVCDEDTKTPSYPNMDGFVDIARHEISHGLYGLCLSKAFPFGMDLTHKHYLGNEFEKIFDDFDYSKLATLV